MGPHRWHREERHTPTSLATKSGDRHPSACGSHAAFVFLPYFTHVAHGAHDTSGNHDGLHLPPRNLLRWFVMPYSTVLGVSEDFCCRSKVVSREILARDFSMIVL